jgi:hypothetical protein
VGRDAAGRGRGILTVGTMEDDGLFLPEVRAHSLEKIKRHNFYGALPSTPMNT